MVKNPQNSRLKPVADRQSHEHAAPEELLATGPVGRSDARRQTLALVERGDPSKLAERGASAQRRPAPPAVLSEHIGRELRGLYDEVVAQPVPERFLQLLNKLEAGTISPAENSRTPEVGD